MRIVRRKSIIQISDQKEVRIVPAVQWIETIRENLKKFLKKEKNNGK